MPNGPSRRQRRNVAEEVERGKWRLAVFDRLRERPRYRNIIDQDLRPLSRDTPEQLPTVTWSTENTLYAQKVREVADNLRLTDYGQPTAWACEEIDLDVQAGWDRRRLQAWADASGQPWLTAPEWLRWGLVGDMPAERRVSTAIQLSVTEDNAQIMIRQQRLRAVQLPGSEFYFDRWDELRLQAHQLLDESLDDLQARYDALYPNKRNPTTELRWADDCDVFVDYMLSGRRPVDPATTERLRRFANLIGVDFAVRPRHTKTRG